MATYSAPAYGNGYVLSPNTGGTDLEKLLGNFTHLLATNVNQRMRRRPSYVQFYRPPIDAVANWSVATNCTLASETTLVGSALNTPRTSVRITKTSGSGSGCTATLVFGQTVNLQNKLVHARFYLGNVDLTMTSIYLYLYSGGYSTRAAQWRLYYDTTAVNKKLDGWYDMWLPMAVPIDATADFDPTAVYKLIVGMNFNTANSAPWCVMDSVEFYNPTAQPGRLFITFDDGAPDNLTAARYLAAKGIRATFFVVANRLAGNPASITLDQCKMLRDMGHLIGNHSWSHQYWNNQGYTEAQKRAELFRAVDYMNANGLTEGAMIFAVPGGGSQWSYATDEWALQALDYVRLTDCFGAGHVTLNPYLNYGPVASVDSVANATSRLAYSAQGLDTTVLFHNGALASIETYFDAVAAARDAGTVRPATMAELICSGA
jgi:peptidoglycan/xylan/chitin deacetylase (PgdA/CDA1 family)